MLTHASTYRSWVEVDLDHFASNLAEIKRLLGNQTDILQTVKADAYGHGAIEISHAALRAGARMLGVANADEGVQLRISGIEAPIVILGPSTLPEIPDIIKYHLTPSVSDTGFANALESQLARVPRTSAIHVEVDTGMGRGGTMHSELLDLIEHIQTLPHIQLEGLFSHYASSEMQTFYNHQQWQLFSALLAELHKRGINIPLKHMENSGAILNYPELKLEMARPGIMTYGIYPSEETRAKAVLKPVMSFKTTIVLLKEFPQGYGIGYNRTYVTRDKTNVATIPVGYGDGYPFILSNTGEALIRGIRAPIIGRVSMDMCTLDVTHIPDCAVGDEVVLLGKQGNEYISANEIAGKARTISYEILCALGKRAPRVFLHKGKTDAVEPRLRRIYLPGEEKSIGRIDSIIRHCFQARARSEELGNAIYYEMFETLFGKKNRQLELRSCFRYDIAIAPLPKADEQRNYNDSYFKLKTHVEYKKTIRRNLFMIGCASDQAQLAALIEDEHCEYRWILGGGEDILSERDFTVETMRIDGEPIPIIETKKTHRGYEIWCGSNQLQSKMNQEVKIELDILTMKAKQNRTFPVYLLYPTRGLEINFGYEDAHLKNVRVESFFSGRNPQAIITAKKDRSINIRISGTEWIFPTSGVIFFWDI
ncbi:MAG TPA: alanine racemase [Smithellaceae bacterium]|nr:alanine racemase [Smithellaceae bacterium]HQM45627.1 alanine racemase [Smithellaceae bacterium]